MDQTVATLTPWRQHAMDMQASYRQTLGTRKHDHFTASTVAALKRKLGYAIYGPPAREPTPTDCGYGREQSTRIDEVFRFVRDANKGAYDYYVSFVFVLCCVGDEEPYQVPVFRVYCCGENGCDKVHGFVDDTPRFYTSWEHYLETNVLPKCVMWYPRGGSYWIPSNDNSDLKVDFRSSQTQITALDFARLGVNLISELAQCGVPVADSIVAGASIAADAINVYENVETLIDRHEHRQSTSLADPTARTCYLNIAGGVTDAAASLGLLKLNRMAAAGEGVSVRVKVVVKGATYVTLVVNGAKVANHFANIIQKRRNGERVDREVVALIASAFFFYNTVLTARRVLELVEEMSSGGDSNGSRALENYSPIRLPTLRCAPGTMATRYSLRQVNDFVWEHLSEHSAEAIRLLWNRFVKTTENFVKQWLDELGVRGETVSFESLELGDVMLVRTALARAKRWIDENLPEDEPRVEPSERFMRGFLAVCGDVEQRTGARRDVREAISRLFFIQQHARQIHNERVERYETDFELMREHLPAMTRERFNQSRGIVGDYREHFMATVIREMKDGGGFQLLCNAVEIMRAENVFVDGFEMEADAVVIPFEGVGLEEQGLRNGDGGEGRPSGIDPENVQFLVDANGSEASIVFTDPNIGIRKITIAGSMHDGLVSGRLIVQC